MCSYLYLVSWLSHLSPLTKAPSHPADPNDLEGDSDPACSERTISPVQSLSYTTNDFENGGSFFPILNSTYRSTFELLRCLPALLDITNVLPALPTRMATTYGLSATLPHSITNPLVR